jgi:hypothetical protein
MDSTLKKLKDIIAENCITIILNTHRTFPDNQKDSLLLKNLIREAEARLISSIGKKDASSLVKRLRHLESDIDHRKNLESLILFVNKDLAKYMRLPIAVENRVVIDKTFATRDLIRALHQEVDYFVLVLSQQKVRLIEAVANRVAGEAGDPFPIENNLFFPTSKAEQANAERQTNLLSEFFNRIDKELNAVRKDNPLPVLICTEESNYYEFLKIADQKDFYFKTFLNRNRVEEKDHAIVKDAWEIVKAYTKENNNSRKAELEKAVSTGRFLSDINDIWKAIHQGRVRTLFIAQGLFQPAIIKSDVVIPVSGDKPDKEDVIDDIYDEMIETNMRYGGDVVFLPKDELIPFNGFGAVTRY